VLGGLRHLNQLFAVEVGLIGLPACWAGLTNLQVGSLCYVLTTVTETFEGWRLVACLFVLVSHSPGLHSFMCAVEVGLICLPACRAGLTNLQVSGLCCELSTVTANFLGLAPGCLFPQL
jgi:hypothetical protein